MKKIKIYFTNNLIYVRILLTDFLKRGVRVEEVKKVDTTDVENLRKIIRKVSVLAKKDISIEQENKLIAKIQTDGIDFSLLEYF